MKDSERRADDRRKGQTSDDGEGAEAIACGQEHSGGDDKPERRGGGSGDLGEADGTAGGTSPTVLSASPFSPRSFIFWDRRSISSRADPPGNREASLLRASTGPRSR